ncbi:hypothetical protein EIN_136540 [Entamoeba invadens IP1]|uniref:Macro domain-containing protein n=1 Tax=Entamoeba invadens IP1 TaxID=370355 RepID=A0A0A1TXD6_ENTIV|nr:hypothetical protein EIN_136540 [Entamoeba invadens IP1]ELP85980.1 hypothetical protein EIN_136540 [Entamoeba invadens IP1]|eukprot:XP_004185326.1 hypothetical protein EIN_136540 [Entamoeba invadens IP1]
MSSTQTTESISSREWFEHITGVTEQEFVMTKATQIHESPSKYTTPELFITNKKTHEDFSCGSFELLSLKDLRKYSTPSTVPAKFEIFIRKSSASLNKVEVSAMQLSPEFKNSVFLVASNFNAVESVSEGISPDSHNFTTNYVYDRTQGPIASIGAPAAAICRVHFPFYDSKIDPQQWGQTDEHQVEILGKLKNKYPVVNGYPLLSKEKKVTESDEDKYIAAIHSNVTAMMRMCGGKIEVVGQADRQKIDQVIAAALNVGQGMSGMRNGQIADKEKSMRTFPLKCGYEATYLTAIKNGRENVVLTLLGNGVFGNTTESVCESIIQTHLKFGIKNNGSIRRVIVPLFSIGGYDALPIFEKLLKKNGVEYEVKVFE